MTSNPAYLNVTECNAAQLSDGTVMLNMRDNRNRGNKEVNDLSLIFKQEEESDEDGYYSETGKDSHRLFQLTLAMTEEIILLP